MDPARYCRWRSQGGTSWLIWIPFIPGLPFLFQIYMQASKTMKEPMLAQASSFRKKAPATVASPICSKATITKRYLNSELDQVLSNWFFTYLLHNMCIYIYILCIHNYTCLDTFMNTQYTLTVATSTSFSAIQVEASEWETALALLMEMCGREEVDCSRGIRVRWEL